MIPARFVFITFLLIVFIHPLCRAESYSHYFDIATSPSAWFIEYPHTEGEGPNIYDYDAPTTLALDRGVYLIETTTTGTIWRDGHSIGITRHDQLYALQVGELTSRIHNKCTPWTITGSTYASAVKGWSATGVTEVSIIEFDSWDKECRSDAYTTHIFPITQSCNFVEFMFPGVKYKAVCSAVLVNIGSVDGYGTSNASIRYMTVEGEMAMSVIGIPVFTTKKSVTFAGPPLPDLDSPRNGDWWVLF